MNIIFLLVRCNIINFMIITLFARVKIYFAAFALWFLTLILYIEGACIINLMNSKNITCRIFQLPRFLYKKIVKYLFLT